MQKPLMIFIAAGFLIAGIFVYFNRPGPCANILDQKAPKLSLSVDAVKATGALVIGSEKVQDVSDGAREVGAHLTACCIAQHSDPPLPPDQYQACVNGAKDYEAKIIQIPNIIKEADKAKQQGNTQLADQKIAEAKETVDASASIAFEQQLATMDILRYQKLVCVSQDGKLGGHGSATRRAIHEYLVKLGAKAETDPDQITTRDDVILRRQMRDGKSACAE